MKVIEVRDDKLIQTVQVWWVSGCVRGKFVLLRLALGGNKALRLRPAWRERNLLDRLVTEL